MQFPNELPSLYDLLRCARSATHEDRVAALAAASSGVGLSLEEAALLLAAGPDWSDPIFEHASAINRSIKGRRIEFYGVVYIHDYCVNSCHYCGDSREAKARRRLLTLEEFRRDVQALLSRWPLRQICFLMGEDPQRFPFGRLVEYLQDLTTYYDEEVILNIPPLSADRFATLRRELPPKNPLQFRVFQETYDRQVYAREHTHGPKKDFDWRVASQARALEASIDRVGLGVLYGLNEDPNGVAFETLAMLAHARDLHRRFGRWPKTMSFPTAQDSPDVDYRPSLRITEDQLRRALAVAKLSAPQVDTVLTCRESAEVRRRLRPVVNIEDFAARPGPGGNSDPAVRQQMSLGDMRSGEEVSREMRADGYEVR